KERDGIEAKVTLQPSIYLNGARGAMFSVLHRAGSIRLELQHHGAILSLTSSRLHRVHHSILSCPIVSVGCPQPPLGHCHTAARNTHHSLLRRYAICDGVRAESRAIDRKYCFSRRLPLLRRVP